MGWLRHYYHKRFGRHGRFHLAVVLTVVVVAYVLVPWVAQLVDAARGYSPVYYEPKDFTRQDYLRQRGIVELLIPWKLIVNVVLLLLVAIVWLTLLPGRGTRRR